MTRISMQAIILASGEGQRMRPLTTTTPKPLLKVGRKTFLEHIFASFPDEVTEVIVVTRYLGEQIRAYCSAQFMGRKVIYADGSPQGTAYSFLAGAEKLSGDRFLVVYGDEIPNRGDMVACLSYPLSVLCWNVENPQGHGVAVLRPDGTIAEIIEKPTDKNLRLLANGVMVLNKTILSCLPRRGPDGEFFLSDMLNDFVKKERVVAVKARRAIGGISTPADIARAEQLLRL